MTTRAVEEKERVCVTGAGGYVASWLVKFLLLKGYMVHGTVREPSDEKNAHLKKLENASENLQLFKANLLDYEGLCAAIAGCTGVFHVACPVPVGSVPNPEVDFIEPAVVGTRNVLDACLKAKAKKVVVVSSIAAVGLNPNWPKNQVMDENCWSDKEACKANKNFYSLAKTMAETEALEYAEKGGLDIVTVCPSIVIGPMLQPTINASSLLLLALLTDGHKTVEDTDRPLVDVRDVAEALLLVYEKPEAKGRYICTSYQIKMQALVHKLKSIFPNYSYSKSFTEDDYEANLSSERLQKLGWKYRPLEEILRDAVMNYEEKGILHKA
ncbi:cinnamoyl-CoA reductase 2-like [Pistacia vera]|uniref:cinnamoyl-CoA reductase 2-like n=1 Tax=Pistacia vera TaxID=55513 RepID=UPI001263CBED|nr:cinnamoyl-CoA reductase 2-like [Pistacia vera]